MICNYFQQIFLLYDDHLTVRNHVEVLSRNFSTKPVLVKWSLHVVILWDWIWDHLALKFRSSKFSAETFLHHSCSWTDHFMLVGFLLIFLESKIIHGFRHFNIIQMASWTEAIKRRRRLRSLVWQKKRRRLLPFLPSEDPDRRLKQMGSLATALTTLQMEFSDDLTYVPGMASRSANQAEFEEGGMQV